MSGTRAAIEERRDTDQPIALADLVGRERPLGIGGLWRDWLMVAWARQSDTAFARAWPRWTTAAWSMCC